MTTQTDDQQFWQLIDTFIQHANAQGQASGAPPHVAGAALMFAAARFNAYVLARSAANAEQFRTNMPGALEYFRQQFDKMMTENMDDYAANFEKYEQR